MLRACLAVSFLLWICAPLRAEADLGTLIDKVTAAYGGNAAVSRLAAMRQHGRTVSNMRGGAAGAITRSFQWPDRLRIEIAYPGEVAEVRVLDGPRGWKNGEPAPLPLHRAMVLQAARMAVPLLLRERAADIEEAGSGIGPDGATLRILRVPLGEGLDLFVDVDAGGLIRRSRGVMTMGAAGSMEFGAEYSDFRTWDGVVVAAHEEQFAMGHHIGRTELDDVELPDSLPAETFRP